MSLFSKLLRRRRNRSFQVMFEESIKKTESELKPLSELGLAIVRASMNCRDSVKHSIDAPSEQERQLAEISAFYEFIYFFMHLAMREASVVIPVREIKHLQDYLGPAMASTAIDSYCQHWPDEIKSGLTLEFYKNLNAAEVEYAKCTQFDSSAPPEERSLRVLEALFTSMGARVAGRAGGLEASSVSSLALKEFSTMNLGKLVENISASSV